MSHSSERAFAAAASFSLLFLIACSSSSSTPTAGGGAETDAGKNGGTCSAKTDSFSCFDCCNEQVGLTSFDGEKIWDDCACSAPGACKTACAATYCKAPFGQTFPEDGDDCSKCLDAQEDACGTKVDEACAKDATCAKALACSDEAKCEDKPLPADTGDTDGGK